jgi:hypothetical protein
MLSNSNPQEFLMNRCAFFFLNLTVILLVVSGCAVEPSKLKVTSRDKLQYVEPGVDPSEAAKETRYPVAIIMAEASSPDEEAIYKSLDSSLTYALSSFEAFTIVERSNLGLLQLESMLDDLDNSNPDNVRILDADYLITARISNATTGSPTSLPGSRKAVVDVDFRFYENASQRMILTKLARGESTFSVSGESATGLAQDSISRMNSILGGQFTPPPSPPPQAQGELPAENEARALADAAGRAATAFADELGARYAPPARVLETRGSGKVALISIGKNYGVSQDTQIEFFVYQDNSAILQGATRDISPVGFGQVIRTERDRAWVEVKGKSSQIQRGHYARVMSR